MKSPDSESEETLSDMSEKEFEQDQNVEILRAQLETKEKAVEELTSRLKSAEETAAALSAQLAMKERSCDFLSDQLSAKEYELRKITQSLGWRLLSRYGRIKYRYLLSVYKALGLPPYDKKARFKAGSAAAPPLVAQKSADHEQSVSAGEGQEEIALPYESNACDIVCFPIIDWDFRYQRPQQLMSRFASAGHRVFYVSHTFLSSGAPYTIQRKRKNIYEISLSGHQGNVYADVLNDEARDALLASLDALRRDLLLGATVSFVELPFWARLADKARAEFGWPVVYDCMDHHAGFSTNKQQMIDQEHGLLSSADLVVTSSEFLERLAREYNRNVLVVRNACDFEHFADAGKAQNRRPVIGYYGAIAEWFDSDLVAALAEKRPDWDFLLVGSTFTSDTRRLSKLPNVSLPGEQHYSEIPGWLGKFDVAIIPFKRTTLTEATNPVKAYEILASGKPLVSVPIPEMASLAPLVRLASTPEEFEAEITTALTEPSELAEQRNAFAKDHTWEKRFEVLAPAVRDLFPKASIIIVTFNNLALNRMCLETLYARTDWPNFEVIVLDNGSTDGTPDFLKQAEKRFPNLKVILNGANLGFARANNIGLKQASGDYLVLLNNDTVLTRGWLSTLIRHLHANHEIGLIGPVTNEIGNEAKVTVGYRRFEELPAWAANYVRENDNQLFDIPMLAMFCAAMRRETIERVGLLDESFEIGMFEDDDYARRIQQAGFKLVCCRDSFVHHVGRASFKQLDENRYLEVFQKNRKTYEQKWGAWKPHLDEKTKKQVPGLLKQLRHILKHSGVQENRVVVFLPSIGWNTPLMQRPQHLAKELARQGYLVFFDCSGSIIDHFAEFSRAEKNLWLYKGPVGVLETLDNAILWALPYNAPRADRWRKARVVYDFIDDLSVFPYQESELRKNHEKMLERADLVLCVAKNLIDQVKGSRPDAVYAPNAVEYDLFSASTPRNGWELDVRFRQLVESGRPIAGYYGAIAGWLDAELITEAARRRPDWNFVLIGQKLDGSPSLKRLEELQNVLVLRQQPYRQLPGFLASFTAAMIPFKIDQITTATSPIKLYEYFAAGKPVITTPMPECEAFDEVLVVRDAEGFSQALDASSKLSGDSKYQQRVRRLGSENSWAARVKSIMEELSSRPERNNARDDWAVSDGSEVFVDDDAEISDAAGELAERFKRFRTRKNTRFFDALTEHFAPIANDSCVPMYFEYAITCNERGRAVASLLQRHMDLRDKSYLDAGCAYAGFLVAFAKHGARVTGVDIDETLLHLAQFNLMDHEIDAPLLTRDITQSADLIELRNSFDIITCNDVIEHVDDPQALLHNISDMLREEGIVYFEIPNRYFPRFVLQDGHYQLFGITLLDYPEAERYYSLHSLGAPYTVRHYLEIDQYANMFANAGLQLRVMPESFEGISIESALDEVGELRANAETGLKRVPAPLRERVREQLSKYLDGIEHAQRVSDQQKRDFKLRYGMSFWRMLGQKTATHSQPVLAQTTFAKRRIGQRPTALGGSSQTVAAAASQVEFDPRQCKHASLFSSMSYHCGTCNICGLETAFFYSSKSLYRESLTCGQCLTTSRYRSIARGILRAIWELTGLEVASLAELERVAASVRLRVYDTQVAFSYQISSYPIPERLLKCDWLDLETSLYRPGKPLGVKLREHTSNQNLEKLTFADNSFDIVITSDVMEHVRLDDRAHREIRRVLKSGGVYLFTVPHFRHLRETQRRVDVVDPSDPSKDVFLMEKEYHGDANAADGSALCYRAYGTELDDTLRALGFDVEYCKEDFPQIGIMNTELFYCRLSK